MADARARAQELQLALRTVPAARVAGSNRAAKAAPAMAAPEESYVNDRCSPQTRSTAVPAVPVSVSSI